MARASRLLRPRGKRPRDRSAAEQCDEIATFQLIELHSIPSSQTRIVRVWDLFHNPPTSLSPVRVIRVGLRLGRSPIHVRSTPNSDRKFKALLFVAMCQHRTRAVQQKNPIR
jgi:hypothetical protein